MIGWLSEHHQVISSVLDCILQKSSHASGIPLLLVVVDRTSTCSSPLAGRPCGPLAFKMLSGDCSRPFPCPLGHSMTFMCDNECGHFLFTTISRPSKPLSSFPKELHTPNDWDIFSWRIVQNLTFQASSSHLDAYSVQGCALHCLEVRPETRFAMVSSSSSLPGGPHIRLFRSWLLQVSYRPAPFLGLLGDKFNCICGMDGAIKVQKGLRCIKGN